jgi:serine/threonine-protein kinase
VPLGDDARFCPACGKQAISTETSANSMPVAERDMIGREIAGRYRILKKLGEGGMGAVYRGEQISLKRQVAVKVLRPELSANQMLLRRFNAEAEAVAKLNHPNTVGIYDFGQDTDGALFIAMEFIEGRSLRSVINHEAPFHPARALAIASQVAAALTDAHAHAIVHRDLKPDNVMLQDRGRQKDVVRVLDFGIAKLRDDSRATQQAMTQAGDMLGTPQYMAPEQIKGEPVDGRVDIYALGCLIYEMVTARQPFEATTVMAMLSKHLMETVIAPSLRRPELGISPEIDRLVLSAMMKQPAARPPTMELFGEQIAAVLATLPPDPNRGATAQASAVQNIPPAITPPAPSMYAATEPPGAMTPPGAITPGIPQQYAPPVAAMASQFPPSQLPTMMRGAGRKKSKAPLWIGLLLVVLGGGGVAAYFATRPSPKTDSIDPTPTPEPEPTPEPPKKDPWSDGSGAPQKDPWAGGATPTLPSGTVYDVIAGVKLIVPHGYQVKKQGTLIAAGNASSHLLIAAGPILTTLTDPKDVALEYAKQNHLTFDGLTAATYAGATRLVATFHGSVNGVSIAQLGVGYTGAAYNVGVTLTMPQSELHASRTQRFASELFDKRVILP